MLARRRGRRRRRHSPVSASDLENAEDRLLAFGLDRIIAEGFRTPDELLKWFPPADIAAAFAISHRLRKSMLAVVAGFTARKAARQSPKQTGLVVARAFADGDATAELLLQLVTADDCVRYLDRVRLWHFVAGYNAWQRRPGDAMPLRRTVNSLLMAAVDEGMIEQHEVFARIGARRLALWLPPDQIAKLVTLALRRGNDTDGRPPHGLARAVSLAALARAVPPMMLLERVLVPLLHPRMLAPRPEPVLEASDEDLVGRLPPPPPPRPRSKVARRAKDHALSATLH